MFGRTVCLLKNINSQLSPNFLCLYMYETWKRAQAKLNLVIVHTRALSLVSLVLFMTVNTGKPSVQVHSFLQASGRKQN